MPGSEPSHGEILAQIGELKGQVSTLITLVREKRDDINAAFTRINVLEKNGVSREELSNAENRIRLIEKDIAKWAGVCLAVSFSFPIVIPYLSKIINQAEHPAATRPAP
jgi:TFIIF-interacting CTD phosphatase-like protein